jgi:hypothetical protein
MICTYSARVIEYGIILLKNNSNKIETRYFKEIGAHLEVSRPQTPLLSSSSSTHTPTHPLSHPTNTPKLDPS